MCVRVTGCVGQRRLEHPGNGGKELDPLSVQHVCFLSPTYVRVHNVAHVCAVCWGDRGRVGCGRDMHTPVITLASDAGREEIPPTVLSEPKLPNYVVVLNLSFSACKWGDLRFTSLMLG